MSHITMPDPHPGRCKNFRSITHSDTYIETLRCLEYENEPHRCRFPKITHVVASNIFQTSDTPQPKPWVRPENTS
jgi:hypothetical protein